MYGNFGGIFHIRSALFGIDGYDDPYGCFDGFLTMRVFFARWVSLGKSVEFFFKESLLGGSS